MDPPLALHSATIESPDDFSTSRSSLKGILRKSKTANVSYSSPDRSPTKPNETSQIKRKMRVSFTDKAKNLPISTIFEIEPIEYEPAASPRGGSCACLLF